MSRQHPAGLVLPLYAVVIFGFIGFGYFLLNYTKARRVSLLVGWLIVAGSRSC